MGIVKRAGELGEKIFFARQQENVRKCQKRDCFLVVRLRFL